MHRRHHQYSDTPEDPHSPHHEGPGILGVLKGFWHAYIGWFFDADPPDLERYVKDLSASRTLRITSALFPLWIGLGLSRRTRGTYYPQLAWRVDWIHLGWAGPRLPRPSCDVERELGLPSVGPTTLSG